MSDEPDGRTASDEDDPPSRFIPWLVDVVATAIIAATFAAGALGLYLTFVHR